MTGESAKVFASSNSHLVGWLHQQNVGTGGFGESRKSTELSSCSKYSHRVIPADSPLEMAVLVLEWGFL